MTVASLWVHPSRVSYRDELAAALARISALEKEQRSTHAEELAHLRTANAGLRTEVRRLKAVHQEALGDVEKLRLGKRAPLREMPSLIAHNEGAPPLEVTERACVLCSECASAGLDREMYYVDEGALEWGALVVCTECAATGLKRL